MMLRFLPKRSLFAAVSLTAVIFVLYYAWNPPTSKLQRSRLAKIDVEVVDNVLKAPLKSSNPTNDDLVRVENSSSHNFLDLPPDVSETEAVCRPLPLKVASIETSEIYPKLNFNVRSNAIYFDVVVRYKNFTSIVKLNFFLIPSK